MTRRRRQSEARPAPAPTPEKKRRRAPTAIVAVLAVCAVAAGAWFVAERLKATDVPTPSPGSIDDPYVAGAVDSALAAVRAAPADADAWANLAMTYDANWFPALASPCFAKAIELRPGVAAWWYDFAFVLEREDRYDEAVAALAQASRLAPDEPQISVSATTWALARGRFDDAEVSARRAMDVSGGSTAACIALGRVLLERGRDQDAAATLSRAVASWPKEWGEPAYPRFLLGTALARLGRAAEAAPMLANGAVDPPLLPDPWREAVRERGDGLIVRLHRADRLVESGRVNEAIAQFEELHRRRPDSLPVANDLASAYVVAGRADEAIALLRETAAKHPRAVEPGTRLVKALWDAGRRDEALREADAVVSKFPGSIEALWARGDALLDSGRAADALADFEAIARFAPNDAWSRASCGVAQLARSRTDLAKIAFEDALHRDSAQPTAIAGMAVVALARGDVAGADAWLAKIEHVPSGAARLVAEARAARAKAR